ncbi:MAG: type II toxin-antitoxin system RelE/ParE family toxin [Gemmatimonadales bacterium]|nr:type II toxin-antitoxin system RelE/ParE family toxin [Gemmatimonadales bacterium]
MASYNVRIKPSAVKELEAVPAKDRRRIATKIRALATNPRPVGCEKLAGHDKYRVRQGNYRVLYTIEDDVLVVTVIAIGNRRDVYRR